MADWLQILALYSSVGFRGLNEEWFWRDFESVRSRYPDMGLERYREAFERRAAQPPDSDFACPLPERAVRYRNTPRMTILLSARRACGRRRGARGCTR